MLIAYGRVNDGGILEFENPGMVQAALKDMGEQRVVVEIKRYQGKRSAAANSYYWGVVVKAMADTTGELPLDCHELLKFKCNAKVAYIYNPETGKYEEHAHGQSTTILSPQEFGDYVDRCTAWLADLSIFVEPEPSDSQAPPQTQGSYEED